jgi:hypothetical protein
MKKLETLRVFEGLMVVGSTVDPRDKEDFE